VIQGLLYVPETLTVRRGDVVVWINKDPFPHTVTAAGVFDSKSIAAGGSWRYQAREGRQPSLPVHAPHDDEGNPARRVTPPR
jgi:plastocyanin